MAAMNIMFYLTNFRMFNTEDYNKFGNIEACKYKAVSPTTALQSTILTEFKSKLYNQGLLLQCPRLLHVYLTNKDIRE